MGDIQAYFHLFLTMCAKSNQPITLITETWHESHGDSNHRQIHRLFVQQLVQADKTEPSEIRITDHLCDKITFDRRISPTKVLRKAFP